MKPLEQFLPKRKAKRIADGRSAIGVSRTDDGHVWHFDDGGTALGSCIRCDTPACMFFAEEELEFPAAFGFPADMNSSVCATGALTWPEDANAPVVEQESCIGCGLCALRCPARAIRLDGLKASINDHPNQYFEQIAELATSETEGAARQQLSIESEYPSLVDGEQVDWIKYDENFVEISAAQTAQFPNHLVRNFLIGLGVICAMRRRGDTNIRMDLVTSRGDSSFGTVEVEFGAEALNSPRNVLDNIAVLHNRYDIATDQIDPLIVTYSLPNNRSEFWKLLADFKAAIDIHISVATIGVLQVLLWYQRQITSRELEHMMIDEEFSTLEPLVSEAIGDDVGLLSLPYLGMLGPAK